MSISDNYFPVKQLGNGVTVEFTGSWQVLNESFIRVAFENVTTGVQVPQTLDSDFTLSFDEDGFVVDFTISAPPPSTEYVVISREVSEDQIVPYRTSKGFQGRVIEDSFDKLTAINQDQSDQITRSPKFQVGSSAVGELPEPVDGEFPVWSGTSGAMANSGANVVDLQQDAADAAASASAAAVSEANAATSVSNAAASEANAAASAQAAADSVASVNLPTISGGDAGKYLEVNSGETGYDLVNLIEDKPGATIAATDSLIFSDADDGDNIKQDTVQGVLDLMPPTPVTTKGDLYTYDTGDARLPVGSNGQFLSANSSKSTGLEWVDSPVVFTSGAQTIVNAGLVTVAHGLGSRPDIVQLYFKCTIADMGYSVGDEIIIDYLMNDTSSSRGTAVIPSTTNVSVRFSANPLRIPRKDTSVVNTMDINDWDLYIKAVRF